MNFAVAEKIANAVLYEGYMLYPYRPSSTKNQQRWNFGTLYPRSYAESDRPPQPCRLTTECLLRADDHTTMEVRVRFLQLVRQDSPVEVGSQSRQHWEEGIERLVVNADLRPGTSEAQVVNCSFHFKSGDPVQQAKELTGHLEIRSEALGGGVHKLRVEVLNVSAIDHDSLCTREQALLQSFTSAHVLLGAEKGEFISLLEAPDELRAAAAGCENAGVFPVLVGQEGQRDLLLCSPIILYDYPKTAPESTGDFFDGTEMDEMLALRVLTLTDQEKAEMLQADDRSRAILERTEMLPAEHFMKVHGAIRSMRTVTEEE
jgi:hypothetical protein